jgi:hypothetical protein
MTFSQSCQTAILNATGITVQELQGLAAAANLVDATTVNTPAGAADFPNSPALAAAAQARYDAQTGIVGTTLAQLFNSNPLIAATGQYGGGVGGTIFYGPIAFGSGGLGSAYQLYTMFHETFHLAGFSDVQLETDFGITPGMVKSRGSASITDALISKCGT